MPLNNFDRLITWAEFTTVFSRPSGVNEDAKITADSTVRYRIRRRGNAISIVDARVTIVTTTVESWVVSNKKTDWLLKHEQGHYDITALGTRALYNELPTLTADSTRELEVKKTALTQKYQNKIDTCNSKYDNLTNHGLNNAVQDTWNLQIATAKTNISGTIDDLPS